MKNLAIFIVILAIRMVKSHPEVNPLSRLKHHKVQVKIGEYAAEVYYVSILLLYLCPSEKSVCKHVCFKTLVYKVGKEKVFCRQAWFRQAC